MLALKTYTLLKSDYYILVNLCTTKFPLSAKKKGKKVDSRKLVYNKFLVTLQNIFTIICDLINETYVKKTDYLVCRVEKILLVHPKWEKTMVLSQYWTFHL